MMSNADTLYADFCTWFIKQHKQHNQYDKGNSYSDRPANQSPVKSRHLYLVCSTKHDKAKVE